MVGASLYHKARLSLSVPRRGCCYNRPVPRKIFVLALAIGTACACAAQTTSSQQPQVKVNVLNVCTPSPDEQKEIAGALAGIPKKPSLSVDFEVDRGRSVLDPNANPLALATSAPVPAEATAVADFVRIRHDLNGGAYSTVQYSFSRDSHQMVETLVFRVRDPKEILQVSIEDSASSVASAAAMLGATTPVGRIKLERFGKSSVVLARCSASAQGSAPDQSAYEPQFSAASALMSAYRDLLGARRLVPEELSRLSAGAANHPKKVSRSKP